MNTLINYLYRDASNYKVWNRAVVEGALTEDQKQVIYNCLEDGENFIPSLVGLPEKTFVDLGYTYDKQDDTPWFELHEDAFEETTDSPTISLTAQELYENFAKAKGHWIDMF